jgi:hypothetical protein
MIEGQDSEKIFLQPIDQNYEDENFKDELKFCDEYSNLIDCLDMSDSETKVSDDEVYRLEYVLRYDWKETAECFKAIQILTYKNMFKRLAYSCPAKQVVSDGIFVNPFLRRSSSEILIEEKKNS